MRTLHLLGIALLLPATAWADAAPPPGYVDPCSRVPLVAGEECVECAIKFKDKECHDHAATEGFQERCSGQRVRFCRKKRCTEKDIPAKDRSRCQLVEVRSFPQARATFPWHQELCKSYEDPTFATSRGFGRRILCENKDKEKQDAPDLGKADRSRTCVSSHEKDCTAQCKLGNVPSCLELGRIYTLGSGALPDGVRAADAWDSACKLGDQQGCVSLAGLLSGQQHTGTLRALRMPPMDVARAQALYDYACSQKVAAGCGGLGVMLLGGNGVQPNGPRAAEMLDKACEMSHVDSCFKLGDAHANGWAMPQDRCAAAKAYARGCAMPNWGSHVNCAVVAQVAQEGGCAGLAYDAGAMDVSVAPSLPSAGANVNAPPAPDSDAGDRRPPPAASGCGRCNIGMHGSAHAAWGAWALLAAALTARKRRLTGR